MQCRILSNVKQAVLIAGFSQDGTPQHSLCWPDNNKNPTALLKIAKAALGSNQVVIKHPNGDGKDRDQAPDAVAYPISLSGTLFGVIAVEMENSSESDKEDAALLIHSGAQWLPSLLAAQVSMTQVQQAQTELARAKEEKVQLAKLVDLVATGLEPERYRVAAGRIVNELARELSCHQVSLGFIKRGRVRVTAMSHTPSKNRYILSLSLKKPGEQRQACRYLY